MRKLLILILFLPLVAVSQSNQGTLITLSEITVKPGHEAQFLDGVKSWKECYVENEGTNKWNMWRRLQGEGSVYTLTTTMVNWAEMDKDDDAAGKECRMIVMNFIMPHVKSMNYNIARSIPELSRTTPMSTDSELVNVYNVKTSNSSDFREVVDALSATMKAAQGELKATWYAVIGGGPEVSDYFVVVPYKNFADLDNDRDGVWKMHEKANGKAKTDALRAKFRSSVSSDWSYMYTLNKKLSN
jgi:hypothetical protein